MGKPGRFPHGLVDDVINRESGKIEGGLIGLENNPLRCQQSRHLKGGVKYRSKPMFTVDQCRFSLFLGRNISDPDQLQSASTHINEFKGQIPPKFSPFFGDIFEFKADKIS